MGFNIQQYEVASAYNNASGNDALQGFGTICVNGSAIYNPATYVTLQSTKKGREKISNNREICQARKSEKQASKSGETIDSSSTTASNVDKAKVISNVGLTSANTDTEKSNTGMYIGIGVGILAIGIVAIVLIKRRNK